MEFTSARERRLWRWTAVAVFAVFAGLLLARTLVGALPEAVTVVLFASALLLVPVAVVVQVFRTRPGGLELGVGLAITLAYMLVLVRLTSPVERSHVLEYSAVALLMYEALLERALHRPFRVPPAVVAFGATATLGVLDEVIQLWIPDRVFDPLDIVFNTMAAFMAVTSAAALRWARTQVQARGRSR